MVEESPAASEQLRVYLLGPPRVEAGHVRLSIPRRQVRALLYRLAAEARSVPREGLCFLFWPDTPESEARRALTHLLTHLRRALPAPDLLLTPGDRIGLDPERVTSDLETHPGLPANRNSRTVSDLSCGGPIGQCAWSLHRSRADVRGRRRSAGGFVLTPPLVSFYSAGKGETGIEITELV